LQKTEVESSSKKDEILDLQKEIENSKDYITEMKNLNVEYSKEIHNLVKNEEFVANSLQQTEQMVEKVQNRYEVLERKHNMQKEENQALQDLIKFRDLEQVEKISSLQVEIENLNSTLETTRLENDQIENQLIELIEKVNGHENTIDDLEAEVTMLHGDKITIETESKAKEETHNTNTECLQKEIETLNHTIEQNNDLILGYHTKIEQLQDELDTTSHEGKQKDRKLSESFIQVSEFETKEQQFESKTEALVNSLNKVSQELEKCQHCKNGLEKELLDKFVQITELKESISKFEDIVVQNEISINNFLQEKKDLKEEMHDMYFKLEKAGKFNENSLKEKLTMSARQIGVLNQKLTESQ